jgi:membrane protein implicated in regulation of membrane protease activity
MGPPYVMVPCRLYDLELIHREGGLQMRTSWFGRLLVFVLVLVALRLFFHWNISIVGSLVVTLIIYLIMSAFESGGEKRSGQ